MKLTFCDECRYDSGQHYEVDLDGRTTVTRPHHDAANQLQRALELTEAANEQAKIAGRLIIQDAAEAMHELSANRIRDLLDQASIPSSLRGALFLWALHGDKDTPPCLQIIGGEKSDLDNTHGKELKVYRSLLYRESRSVAS